MGSNPSGGAKPPVSAPFQQLLDDIGKSSFYLNTIVVGLDAVEKGHPKPTNLVISWEPMDRIAAARMARHFAVEAFMVRASEALNSFIKAYAALPRFAHVKAKWDKDTGIVEKIYDLGHQTVGRADYLLAGAMTLAAWRNRIVHNGKLALLPHQTAPLLKNAKEIGDLYKNLDIDLLLKHAREGRPTLKDVSCLIAMTINLARKMDGLVCQSMSKEDVLALIEHYGMMPEIQKVLRETAPDKIWVSLERLVKTRTPRIADDFGRLCSLADFDTVATIRRST